MDPKPTPNPAPAWNPRYVAYAASSGRSVEDQIQHDRQAWPGGSGVGFILWISARWQEWRKANGRGEHDHLSRADHADFDAWLSALGAA